MENIFTICQRQITAEAAARHFGLQFDRNGKAICPFHPDHNPSLTFRNSRFRCWSCGEAGDCIDLAAKLFNLAPLAAVKLLNDEFSLDLPIDRPLTGKELRQQREYAKLSRQLQETMQAFQNWRYNLLDKLVAIIRAAGQIQARSIDELSAGQIELLHQLAAVEHWSDILQFGSSAEIMDIFRERRRLEWQAEQILNHLRTKLSVA